MKRLFTMLFFLVPVLVCSQQMPGYYRFPALHENTIIFTAEGDLWQVSTNGGVAQRLTTHQGMESQATISPEGSHLAFIGQYEGANELYTMPISGGIPSRRTFDGDRIAVVRWTSENKILYTTRKYSTLPNNQLVMLDKDLNQIDLIPLHQASDGCFNTDNSNLFFTRLPRQGSRTKRYKGGTAQNIWKYSMGSEEAVPLTADYAGTSKNPVWWKNRIYFVSDRGGTMNLWSMNEEGSDLKQHTFHKGYDISHPDMHGGRIVYQRIADLYIYDIAADTDRKVEITLASDFDQTREKWVKKPLDYLESAHISPDGDQVVLTSRGLVFVAPSEKGRLVKATRKDGIRYRDARFMPDGKSLLILSDQSGELEFWRTSANGLGTEKQLTNNGTVFRSQGLPSPDGKWIAFTDKNYRLWLHEIDSEKTREVATSEISNFYYLNWSPDSKWLTYIAGAGNFFYQIVLYNLDSGEKTILTSDRVDSYDPEWSPDGKYLYFLSDRYFNSLVRSPWGPRQPEPFFDKTTKLYVVPLSKEEQSPFLPENEVRAATEAKNDSEKDDDDKDKKVTVNIDLENIQSRIVEIPVSAGALSDLSVNESFLFFIDRETSVKRTKSLKVLEIKNKDIEVKTYLDGIDNYELSLNGKKLLIDKKENLYITDASESAPSELDKQKVDLSKWTFTINPKDEWRQMFIEAWRLERDYFYDPQMHGVDYEGLLNRYLPFVERVTDRSELNDLISHLVGELSALHIFVFGGDSRKSQDDISVGSLGATLVRDEENDGYRVEHIYKADPDYPDRWGPLSKPEVRMKEGDIITAINGVSTLSVSNPGELLKNQVDKQVLLSIRRNGKTTDKVVVKPISSTNESSLRYDEWELERRLKVEESGNGDLGYLHLRAMGGNNYSEWVRNFYPVFDRKGLIIDVRHNRGGNIDSWILEKLMRKAWFYWQGRVGKPYWNMQHAFRGHIVVLCNEYTASDGEAFAEGFRRLGLGKVIGTRTWGGEIWLSFNNPLVDKGMASAAQTGVYGPEGKWLIEGHGVDPDMVVDNLPHATFNGKDEQLEAAIKFLKDKIKNEPVDVPPPPPFPNKAFDYEKD